MARVATLEGLRALYNEPGGRSVQKVLHRLDKHCRSFIGLSPFIVVATMDADGNADASPRGGSPGFIAVESDRTLLLPDSIGNNRLDSLVNLISSPKIGMVFLIPGVNEVLRINGAAEIRDDDALRDGFAVGTRRPATVLRIHVEEAYLHCAKALMRADLWNPDTINDRSVLPSMGRMLKDQLGLDGEPESQEAMEARYRPSL